MISLSCVCVCVSCACILPMHMSKESITNKCLLKEEEEEEEEEQGLDALTHQPPKVQEMSLARNISQPSVERGGPAALFCSMDNQKSEDPFAIITYPTPHVHTRRERMHSPLAYLRDCLCVCVGAGGSTERRGACCHIMPRR